MVIVENLDLNTYYLETLIKSKLVCTEINPGPQIFKSQETEMNGEIHYESNSSTVQL